ncbi:MAG: hypothetical protein JWN94_3128 [Betaproteobacteria bacterium]|nr:hypothetical protein [Betaproteobacteria bacterium]
MPGHAATLVKPKENPLKAITLIAGSLFAATTALAAEPQINIIFSAENATCTAWTNSADNKLVRQQYEIWARGFASGYNYATPARQVKVGAFPSGDDLYQYFDQYCSNSPQQSFVAATIQLVEQLANSAPAAKPAPARKPASPEKK